VRYGKSGPSGHRETIDVFSNGSYAKRVVDSVIDTGVGAVGVAAPDYYPVALASGALIKDMAARFLFPPNAQAVSQSPNPAGLQCIPYNVPTSMTSLSGVQSATMIWSGMEEMFTRYTVVSGAVTAEDSTVNMTLYATTGGFAERYERYQPCSILLEVSSITAFDDNSGYIVIQINNLEDASKPDLVTTPANYTDTATRRIEIPVSGLGQNRIYIPLLNYVDESFINMDAGARGSQYATVWLIGAASTSTLRLRTMYQFTTEPLPNTIDCFLAQPCRRNTRLLQEISDCAFKVLTKKNGYLLAQDPSDAYQQCKRL
jgi:hypothetical protein